MIEGKPGILGSMLISLDCILDDRAGTLDKLGLLQDAIRANYHNRVADVFPGISKQAFQKAYAKRGADVLARSMISPSVAIIKDFVSKHLRLNSSGPYDVDPRIEVNFYPYDAPPAIRQMILDAIVVLTNIKLNISAVYFKPEDITFDFVRYTYDHIVMYDPGPWIEAQTKDFKRGIPNVTIICPLLNRGEEDMTAEELLNGTAEVCEAYEPLFNLVFMPSSMFSMALNPYAIDRPPRPEGQEEQVKETEQSVEPEPVIVPEQKPQEDDFGISL